MKITDKHIAHFVRRNVKLITDDFKSNFHYQGINEDEKNFHKRIFTKMIETRLTKSYLLRNTLIKIIENIDVSKKICFSNIYEVFIENTMDEIVINNRELVRILKEDNQLIFVYLNIDKESAYNYSYINIPFNKDNIEMPIFNKTDADELLINRIKKILTFIYLSKIKEEELKPNGKIGYYKNERVKNYTNIPFIVVDLTWDTTKIRTQGFNVSGHCRYQPYGFGRSKYNLIYISPFQKHGYCRKAKKLNYISNKAS